LKESTRKKNTPRVGGDSFAMNVTIRENGALEEIWGERTSERGEWGK